MGRSGRVDFRTESVARFDYGSTVLWISRLDDEVISAVAGSGWFALVAQSGGARRRSTNVGDFTVEESPVGRLRSVLRLLHHGPPSAIDPFESLERTEICLVWHGAICVLTSGPWTEAVNAVVLRLKR